MNWKTNRKNLNGKIDSGQSRSSFYCQTIIFFPVVSKAVLGNGLLPRRVILQASLQKAPAQWIKVCSLLFRAKFYAAQIILALEYLHSRNIVYREYFFLKFSLKPENILIEKDGYIKLADFGLSKIFINDEPAFDICGTPEYIAPEVLLKTGHRAPVDWWALGVLVY